MRSVYFCQNFEHASFGSTGSFCLSSGHPGQIVSRGDTMDRWICADYRGRRCWLKPGARALGVLSKNRIRELSPNWGSSLLATLSRVHPLASTLLSHKQVWICHVLKKRKLTDGKAQEAFTFPEVLSPPALRCWCSGLFSARCSPGWPSPRLPARTCAPPRSWSTNSKACASTTGPRSTTPTSSRVRSPIPFSKRTTSAHRRRPAMAPCIPVSSRSPAFPSAIPTARI